MKRKFDDKEIIEDLENGYKVKDILIKYGIKSRSTILDIKKRIGKSQNGTGDINEYIKKMNITHNNEYTYPYINKEFVNSRSKITILCKKCENIFVKSMSHHIWSRTGCPRCSGGENNTIEKIIRRSNKKHGNGRYSFPYIETESLLSNDKITVKCNVCNNIFKQKVSSHINNGNGCSKCNKSKNEKLISNYLEINNVYYISEKKFDTCMMKKPLPFDFYLLNLNLCIEYDGEQHFKRRRNENGDSLLRLRQLRDKIKSDFCLKNGIILERITYLENLKEKLYDIFERYKIDKVSEFTYQLSDMKYKTTKKCCRCHREKDFDNFHKCGRSVDGYKAQCSECRNNNSREKYKNNKKLSICVSAI